MSQHWSDYPERYKFEPERPPSRWWRLFWPAIVVLIVTLIRC